MDLLRAVIKSIFYDFPLNLVAEKIGKSEREGELLDYVVEIVKREEQAFSHTEISMLKNVLMDVWLCDKLDKIEDAKPQAFPFLNRCLLILKYFSEEVLTLKGTYPLVQFKHLLRWRELSLFIGEDNLIIPYLAEQDLNRGYERSSFIWPTIIDHDNFRINAILDQELSDTHTHINAALDVFEFNWLGLMNYPELVNLPEKDKFLSAGSKQEYDSISLFSEINLSLTEWVKIAAFIRVCLYDLCFEQETDIDSRICSLGKFFYEKEFLDEQFNETKRRINILRVGAAPSVNGYKPDYAIRHKDLEIKGMQNEEMQSPYAIHQGERKMLYHFFRRFLDGPKECFYAPYVFLYLLIKSKIRREFAQTNSLVGFENFQRYQKHKCMFCPNFSKDEKYKKAYQEIAFRYAVQTSSGPERNYYVEARLTPGAISKFRAMNYADSIFFSDVPYIQSKDLVSFVAHFIKGDDKKDKNQMFRKENVICEAWKQVGKLIGELTSEFGKPDLCGIDAASSEFNCRPEVFAPVFRYCRFKGLANFTFHAGEDFYDILDGLRTVDELINFMGYTFGCRIGHGLVLGMNVSSYYRDRHFTMIIPQQELLDNIVWLKHKAMKCNVWISPATEDFIGENFSLLTEKLGYGDCDMETYWRSMLRRGDMPEQMVKTPPAIFASMCTIPDKVRYSPVSPYTKEGSNRSEQLWNIYLSDSDCRKEGKRIITVKVPKSSWVEDVTAIQECVLKDIEKFGVVIETNPSSNIKIGRFTRYDEHPLMRFCDVVPFHARHSIVTSINTDDKGVFCTSLRNEYSLIAVALTKQLDQDGKRMWSDLEIETYLRRIAYYGNITRFRKTN